MGIPSYYRKLTTKIKGLAIKSLPQKPSSLFFDFNCLIYHVARLPKLPPYPGHEQKDEWEKLLLDEVSRYVVKVWQEVGQPREVFLSVDGVVPMAKIKQQRMRRFKSVWLAQEEKKQGLRENIETWDTNCITPGTAFMRKLNHTLSELCRTRGWTVSGSDEPGEGEHKIMRILRSRKVSNEPIVLYGLDADLILLTLLNSKSPAFLMREDEDAQVVIDNQYVYFSIEALKPTLPCPVLDYVAAMSLLGNDFLPHSLSVKIKDDGHSLLYTSLQSMVKENKHFVEQNEQGLWVIHYATLQDFLREWTNQEEARMTVSLKKKIQLSTSSQKMLENLPLEWCPERELFSKTESWTLNNSWRNIYRKDWNNCHKPYDIQQLSAEYLFGLQWVLDYYTGQRPVEMTWSFPRLLPPLWSDLHYYLAQGFQPMHQFPSTAPIQPMEQLAMVLPLESWYLLEDSQLRSLPSKLPQFWPQSFGFHSYGKFRLWECEPLIPSLPVERIRQSLGRGNLN